MNTVYSASVAALVVLHATHLRAAEPIMLWSRTYDAGLTYGDISDYPRKVAVDGVGNVIVAGGMDPGWVIIKYRPDGAGVWTNRFHGTDNGSAYAYALDVDSIGNAYVAGFATEPGLGADYVTIKYLPNGTPAWTNRFGGAGDAVGIARAIAVDGVGNVHVTGVFSDSTTGADYATIKYQPDGTPAWTNRFNGSGDGYDQANAVKVDSTGNVYVTGYSSGPGTSEDYVTIKYQPDGTPAWINRFNGPGNGTDVANDLALDGAGNVYVTGYSFAAGTDNDYATIKYQPDGTAVWTNRFNGSDDNRDNRDYANALAVDRAGNVYVTGYYTQGSERHYATIQYLTDGTPGWTNRFDSNPGEAYAIALDTEGNACVTGFSFDDRTGTDFTTIKYRPDGSAVWTNRYNGPSNGGDTTSAIAVDNAGNVYVAGGSPGFGTAGDYATIKYRADGTPVWTNRYASFRGSDDIVSKAVADHEGNIYVAGYSSGFGTASDFLTIKYQSDGTPVWTNRYNGPANSYDQVNDLAVDSVGNVYVTGDSRGRDAENIDYATIKYLADGTPAWTNRFDGSGIDVPFALAVDNAGNAYVTGYSIGTGCDYLTIKYRTDGTTAWINRYDGPDHNCDAATGIAVDNAGNVYVTGTDAGSGTQNDWATIKYQPDGAAVWTNRYNGPGLPGNWNDHAAAIVLDGAGNIYVTGRSPLGSYSPVSGTTDDFLTIKYQPDGTAVWTNRYSGPANNIDVANDLAVDDAGNVYVTGLSGLSMNSNAGADYATIKYQPDGTPAWTNRYNGPGNGFDVANSLAVDHAGNVYVTGASTGSGTSHDYATIKYQPDGTPTWTNRFNGPVFSGSDRAVSVLALASGDIVVVGNITSPEGGSDWLLYRLSEPPAAPEISLFDGDGVSDPELTAGQTAPVDFGTTPVGAPVTRSFTIANSGNAALTVTRIVTSSDFLVGGLNLPASLPPGARTAFTITFRPGASGLYTSTLTLLNNDSDEGSFDVGLIGAGNRPPTARIVTDALMDFSPDFEHPVLISCNWWNSCLKLDGTLSGDPENGALTYQWFVEPNPVPVASGPVVLNCLEVGTHTIILTVTDPAGLNGTDARTIEVVTAPWLIESLIEKVNESRIPRKIKRELAATLRVALNQAGNERLRAMQTALDAFEQKVRVQIARTYATEAAAWTHWSQNISKGVQTCIKPPRKPRNQDGKDPDPKGGDKRK